MSTRTLAVAVFGLSGFACAARGTVTVRFDPPDETVDLSDVFTIDIVADIPDLVVGWGLDLTIDDGAVLSQAGAPVIGGDWSAGSAADGDGLAGLAFPSSVSGSDILVATVTFSADALGETDLFASVTPGDLTEGFALDPTGFADVVFEAGRVTVIPEPSALVLLVLGGSAMLRRRRVR